jgi:hypothetical protein
MLIKARTKRTNVLLSCITTAGAASLCITTVMLGDVANAKNFD